MNIDNAVQAKANKIASAGVKTLATTLGIEFSDLTLQKVAGSMPVDERTKQPFGILHGGASVALAETLASIGAWLNIDEAQFDAVGVEINANHLRPVSAGRVTGVATPVHIGRTMQVWQIVISDEAGKSVCISRCTLSIIPRRSPL